MKRKMEIGILDKCGGILVPQKKVLGIFCVIFQTKRLHLKHFPCFALFEYLVQPEKHPSV
jgi:hypothetical protein